MPTFSAPRYSKAERLVEDWQDRINLVEDFDPDLSYEKKLVLAQCLENTQSAIDLMEATDSGDTSGFKSFALDLVTAVIPNLVANDIVSVQPIDNSVGVINYIKYIYGSDKGTTTAGDQFANGIMYAGSDPYYSSSEVVSEGGLEIKTGSSGTIKGNLTWLPIIKGTIRIPVQYKDEDSKIAYVTDTPQDGTLAVLDVSGRTVESVATGTIDYESGKIDVTFQKDLEENSNTAVTYRYNNFSIGDGQIGSNQLQVPQIDIKIESMPVICQSRKLKALYAFDSSYKLMKEYGQDINALLNTQIAAEITHEIDGEIMNDLLHQAGIVNDSWNMARPEGISLHEHYESFRVTLNSGSNKIFQETKRASANFVIVGMDVATVIESLPSFTSAGATNAVGPHISGTLGNLMVVKNPYFKENEYVLGYKGVSLFDAGSTKTNLIAA